MRMGNVDRVNLDAIKMRELDDLLRRFGLLNDFKKKKLKCKFCREIVTKENIYSIMKDSGHIKLVCEKGECVSKMMELLDARSQKKVGN